MNEDEQRQLQIKRDRLLIAAAELTDQLDESDSWLTQCIAAWACAVHTDRWLTFPEALQQISKHDWDNPWQVGRN